MAFESCFRNILLIPSGLVTFPSESEFKVSSTSCGFHCFDSNECLFLGVNGEGE